MPKFPITLEQLDLLTEITGTKRQEVVQASNVVAAAREIGVPDVYVSDVLGTVAAVAISNGGEI